MAGMDIRWRAPARLREAVASSEINSSHSTPEKTPSVIE
jgi:hypothetical protein